MSPASAGWTGTPERQLDHKLNKKSGAFAPDSFLCAVKLCVADAVDVTGEVEHLVGEAPLIVIPCNELYEVAVESEKQHF